jgi:exopolysaccharide biosynthesis protein
VLDSREAGLFMTSENVPQVLPTIDDSALKPNPGYVESFESFPVLIAGQHIAFFKDNPSERARRSVVAQDVQGNILIIYSSSVEISLTEMANWIQNSGLGVVTALNLDGGSSSQLHISGADFSTLIQGNAQVPVVLAVYLRYSVH